MNSLEITIENDSVLLRDAVYYSIRDAIFRGEYATGEKLVSRQLAETMGTGRSTILRALKQLELDGFIEIIPKKGTFVLEMNEEFVNNLLDVVLALELLAINILSENISENILDSLKTIQTEFNEAVANTDIKMMVEKDEKFHYSIYESTNNDILIQTLNNLKGRNNRCRYLYFLNKNYRNIIYKEHEELLKALADKNKDQAINIVKRHIKNQERAIIISQKSHTIKT